MPSTLKSTLPLLAALALGGAAWWLFSTRAPEPSPPAKPPAPMEKPQPSPALSVLGETPDWSSLNVFQNTITRADFERLLTTIFTTGEAWRNFIEIDDAGARVRTTGEDVFHLRFAPQGLEQRAPHEWRAAAELPPAPADKPLDGLRVAIDPGHIGGEWAPIEERWLRVPGTRPVQEGDMTLLVAKLLKPRLEKLGAVVSLVREKPEPITPLRPDALMDAARDSSQDPDSPEALRKLAERLFYRTAEIQARARLVNETLKPDLVLCLHFNADPWGDSNNPTLVDRSHLHLLLNGGYTDDEVPFADQRFALLDKLLQRTHEEEARVGATVADTFAEKSGLPPYLYPAAAANARPVNGHPYLWARNLLANRLYQCPVIFMEPYVMNSRQDHPRIQAGDYEGLREVAGKPRPSIFREYADALTEGLARHYAAHRPLLERRLSQ